MENIIVPLCPSSAFTVQMCGLDVGKLQLVSGAACWPGALAAVHLAKGFHAAAHPFILRGAAADLPSLHVGIINAAAAGVAVGGYVPYVASAAAPGP